MESIKLKSIVWVVALLLCTNSTFAQTWGELFNQKKTQQKYLLEQIAALKVYAGYVEKGYTIVSSGLETVKDFKSGEFNLHQTFFNSLKSISLAIQKNEKIAQIISIQLSIAKAFNGIGKSEYLSASNHLYVNEVKQRLIDECLIDLEELLLVITAGRVEMTDDQRMVRIDKLYAAMQDKVAFTQNFTSEISLLLLQIENEQKSIQLLKQYYGND